MSMHANAGSGFLDAVHDSQRAFRALLTAMSRPGTVLELPVLPDAPGGLAGAPAAVLLTLADFDTPLWLCPQARTPEAEAFLRFHCGVPLTGSPQRAALAYFASAASLPGLGEFSRGTPESPHVSTTLLLRVEGLASGRGWTITGPGVRDALRLEVQGVSADLQAVFLENRESFPLGLDVIFATRDAVACLPRSVRVEV